MCKTPSVSISEMFQRGLNRFLPFTISRDQILQNTGQKVSDNFCFHFFRAVVEEFIEMGFDISLFLERKTGMFLSRDWFSGRSQLVHHNHLHFQISSIISLTIDAILKRPRNYSFEQDTIHQWGETDIEVFNFKEHILNYIIYQIFPVPQ